MNEQESTFLLSEFEQAWSQVLNTEQRRLKLVVGVYVALTLSVIANLSVLVSAAGRIGPAPAIAATAVTLLAWAGAIAFLRILVAERAVNVRYRRKINLIRGILLGPSTDEQIVDYLTGHKDLGILTAQDPQPGTLGSTLRSIIGPLSAGFAASLGSIIIVWLATL